jgi:hypothetical protein
MNSSSYTAIDLFTMQVPSGFSSSFAIPRGPMSYDGAVVGDGLPIGASNSHALVWNVSGTPVDLQPAGFTDTHARGASEGQQAGYGSGPITHLQEHALLWNGTSAVVDLNPLILSNLKPSESIPVA